MSKQLEELKSKIREILSEFEEEEEKLKKEVSTTGNVAGYDTPRAFNPTGKHKTDFVKRMAGLTGYSAVNEGKYYVSYNKGRGQGKGLSMEFDKKTFKPLDKPKVFNSYKDAKKYADDMEKTFRNSIGGGTSYWVSDEKMNPIKESINENRFHKLRLDQTLTPNQKIGLGIREIRRKIDEIEKFMEWYGKIKKENSLKGENFWKRTNHHIYRIKERLSNIGKTATKLRK